MPVAQQKKKPNRCANAADINSAYTRVGNAILGTPGANTANEKALMRQYMTGDSTPYRMSDYEFARAQAFTQAHPEARSGITGYDNGRSIRSVYFGFVWIADPALDLLLGTAQGYFDASDTLVAVRDVFDFSYQSRGFWMDTAILAIGISPVRLDALTCHGNTQIPVSGGN